eukprot:3629537-Amphidinium_carterae.1
MKAVCKPIAKEALAEGTAREKAPIGGVGVSDGFCCGSKFRLANRFVNASSTAAMEVIAEYILKRGPRQKDRQPQK